MTYIERAVHPDLQKYIKYFWYLEKEYAKPNDREVVWPDGCHEMIFHFGSRYHVSGQALPGNFLIGTLSAYQELKAKGHLRLFGVRFLPWGLVPFVKYRHNLKNRFIPLHHIFESRHVESLEKRLSQADAHVGWSILNSYFQSVAKPRLTETQQKVIPVLEKLYNHPLNYSLQAIIGESGYSQRHFERICMDLVGMSAGQLHNTARFNQARLTIFRQPTIDLHDCMLQYGYYDYPHFSKEFKKCIGCTPLQYKEWIQHMTKNVSGNHVVFLQEDER